MLWRGLLPDRGYPGVQALRRSCSHGARRRGGGGILAKHGQDLLDLRGELSWLVKPLTRRN
jgi:hypothetical protein